MRDKLIQLLGGVSKETHNLLNIQYLQQRELANQYRAQQDYLLSRIEEETTERKKFQDLLLKNAGVNTDPSYKETENNDSLTPIRTSPRRWSELQRSMEIDDHARVAADLKVALGGIDA